jgi:hypothetical protein
MMLSSQGKWQFRLLVGSLGTALCWNGRLLTLGRNFLTLYFSSVDSCQLPLHRMFCPTAFSLQRERKPTHFPIIVQNCWEFVLVLVSSGGQCQCQMW